ncbi:hypothetical protein JW905_10475 [bacterium]|nr:hypothetical protein [candidate division CSSED10-310 bacterium]
MRMILIAMTGLWMLAAGGCNDAYHVDDRTAYFSSENTDPHDNSVGLVSGGFSGARFEVDVTANEIDVAPVGGIRFDLRFCSDIIEYRGYVEGSYLEQGEAPVLYDVQVDGADPDSIHVYLHATEGTSGTDGSGRFLTLKFRGLKEGIDEICPYTFSNQELLDTTQPEGRFISGISWFSGSAQIVD